MANFEIDTKSIITTVVATTIIGVFSLFLTMYNEIHSLRNEIIELRADVEDAKNISNALAKKVDLKVADIVLSMNKIHSFSLVEKDALPMEPERKVGSAAPK